LDDIKYYYVVINSAAPLDGANVSKMYDPVALPALGNSAVSCHT